MKQQATNRFTLFMLLGDAVVLYIAFLLAYFLRIRIHIRPLGQIHTLQDYTPAASILICVCLIVFMFYGLYDLGRRLSIFQDGIKLIKAITLALVLALTLTFFFKYYQRSRSLAAIYWITAICCLMLYRWWVFSIVKNRRRRGWDALHVIVLGIDRKGLAVEKILALHPELGYRCSSTMLLDSKQDLAAGRKTLISDTLAKKIARVMTKKRVDGLILTLPIKYYEQMVGIMEWCEEKGLEVHYITSVLDVLNAQAIQDELQENLFFETRQDQRTFWKDLVKRLMDEIISILALLVTLPVWLVVAMAIKLDSAGPVFFKQERVGRLGRHFTIYKFRTMYTSAPKYSLTPRRKGDPRVTRVGGFLRQTSLDELPQLLNVIKGDMSLVGPRPEQPFMVGKYLRPVYHRRHLVLPGMTGLWQVSGRSDKPLEENLKYDLYYLKHRSFLFDLLILLRTIPTVISKKGAF